MKKFIFSLLAVFASLVSFAQGETGASDFFKSNLKIYVVAAVLTIILILLFVFLFSLEKRLKKLEEKK